jgi:LuxR family transcriptional regulator of csgAB operon
MKLSTGSQAAIANLPSTEALLYITGNNAFNIDVLCRFLEAQTGLVCRGINIADLADLKIPRLNTRALVFVDCAAMGSPETCQLPALRQAFQEERCQFICYNVAEEKKLELNALNRGVKGILYNHQSVDLYGRAAEAVLSGELWFPRKILETFILINRQPLSLPSRKNHNLTRREKEILRMLASGISNQDIADELCISPHTVKTHIYNLYKKIKVANRYQAIQWLLGRQQD